MMANKQPWLIGRAVAESKGFLPRRLLQGSNVSWTFRLTGCEAFALA